MTVVARAQAEKDQVRTAAFAGWHPVSVLAAHEHVLDPVAQVTEVPPA
jgi:Na+-transporting NADH:ubiquinone oxidoreductase subunit NqrA